MARRLTRLQEAFCQAFYPGKLSGTQAAIEAGYSPKAADVQACENLGNPKIRARLEQLQAERTKRTQVDADYVVTTLTEVVERCMQRAPVMVKRGRNVVQLTDEEGRDVWQFDAANVNRAAELLGKTLALFTEKVDVTLSNAGHAIAEALENGCKDQS